MQKHQTNYHPQSSDPDQDFHWNFRLVDVKTSELMLLPVLYIDGLPKYVNFTWSVANRGEITNGQILEAFYNSPVSYQIETGLVKEKSNV